MKVKHSIELNDEEVNTLFDIVSTAAKVMYADSVQEQTALEEAKATFKKTLADYVTSAFKIGKKIGKSKADMKDTEMYK